MRAYEKIGRVSLTSGLVGLSLALTAWKGTAQAKDHYRSIKSEMTVHFDCEVMVWPISAVSIHDIELSSQRDFEANFCNIVYFTKSMTWRHGFLTFNYIAANTISSLFYKLVNLWSESTTVEPGECELGNIG